MLVVSEAVHEEMLGVWAVAGRELLEASGYGPEDAATEYAKGLSAQAENILRLLMFVAGQRLSARATRRRRGVKNDTRKPKQAQTT